MGGSNYKLSTPVEKFEIAGGGFYRAPVARIELRIFRDSSRKDPLTDWFQINTCIGQDDVSCLSGFEMVAKQGLMFATISDNRTLLVAHKSNKLAFAWSIWNS